MSRGGFLDFWKVEMEFREREHPKRFTDYVVKELGR